MQRKEDHLQRDKIKSDNSMGYVVGFIIVFVVFGLFSQWRSNSEYNSAIRVIGAKKECRTQAKRDGISEARAGCDLLGTSDYKIMTDYYYNEYKRKTGTHEL